MSIETTLAETYKPMLGIINNDHFFSYAHCRRGNPKLNLKRDVFGKTYSDDYGRAFTDVKDLFVDFDTYKLLKLSEFHDDMDFTTTRTGSGFLFRSMIKPPQDLEFILAKQEALTEIAENEELRTAVQDYLSVFKRHEANMVKAFNSYFETGPNVMDSFKKLKQSIPELLEAAEKIPMPESKYGKHLVESLKQFADSRAHTLLTEPVYNVMGDVVTKDKISFLTLGWKMRPTGVTPGNCAFALTTLGLVGLYALTKYTPLDLSGFGIDESTFNIMIPRSGVAMLSNLAAWIKRLISSNGYGALLGTVSRDQATSDLFESTGQLDEFMSFYEHSKRSNDKKILPVITDAEQHYFEATDLRDPAMSVKNEYCKENDVILGKDRLTFLSGPNSNGKTTLSLTIARNQIMGQIGGYVQAGYANIGIADKIRIRVPLIGGANYDGGRLEEELKQVKAAYDESTSRSLNILDEIVGGTTFDEQTEIGYKALMKFYEKLINTLVITHNSNLIEKFKEEGIGQYLMTLLRNGQPTYKITPCISKEGHSEHVVQKVWKDL